MLREGLALHQPHLHEERLEFGGITSQHCIAMRGLEQHNLLAGKKRLFLIRSSHTGNTLQ